MGDNIFLTSCHVSAFVLYVIILLGISYFCTVLFELMKSNRILSQQEGLKSRNTLPANIGCSVYAAL